MLILLWIVAGDIHDAFYTLSRVLEFFVWFNYMMCFNKKRCGIANMCAQKIFL